VIVGDNGLGGIDQKPKHNSNGIDCGIKEETNFIAYRLYLRLEN
jgi:hypothetical protein